MISLPLSLIGGGGVLTLTGDTLNIMSAIGVRLLMGIVANLRDRMRRLFDRAAGIPIGNTCGWPRKRWPSGLRWSRPGFGGHR